MILICNIIKTSIKIHTQGFDMKTIKFILTFIVAFLAISFLHTLVPDVTNILCVAYLAYSIAN